MADAVVKLKVESQEFDNKLARATQQLQHMEKEVRRTGASFEFADKEELAFIQSLGQMETKTQSLRTKMREYTESILSLTEMYERLSDSEKNSDFGRGLLSSIDQIKQRAGELKDNMMDLEGEIKHLASDTSTFDSLAGGVNLMVSAFQVGQGIIQMFGVENENAVKAIAKLQGAMAVTNGLIQIQNALQKQSAVMLGVATVQKKALAAAEALDTAAKRKNIAITVAATAAQKALNVVANANPYILLTSAVIALGAALSSLTKKSKEAANQNTQVSKSVEESRNRWQEYSDAIGSEIGGVLSAYARLKIEWEGLSGLQEKNNWIQDNQDEFDKLKISINDVADAENAFVKNTEKVVMALQLRARSSALQRLAEEEYAKYYKAIYTSRPELGEAIEGEIIHGPTPKSAKRKYYYEKKQGLTPGEDFDPLTYRLTQSGADKINAKHARNHGALTLQEIDERYFSKALDFEEQWKNMLKDAGFQSRTEDGGGGPKVETEKIKTAADMWQELSDKIAEAERLLGEFQAMAANTELSEEQRNWAIDMVKKYEGEIKKLKNTKEVIPIQFSDKGINELKNKIKTALSGEIFGSEGYALEATKIVDITTLQNLLNTALTNGLNVDMTYLSGLFESIKLDADIDDSTWDALVAEINAKLKELKLPEIVLDVKTGNITNVANDMAKDAAKATDEWQQAVSAVGQLGGALQGLEDPSAKVAGIIAQAVANIALTFATSLKGTVTPWDWIAAAISGTATMIGTISAIKSATKGGFANGGIVPGNSFSGDNLHTSDYGINSGELILNRAQQNTIASQLQGGAAQNMRLEALISGESLRMVLANNASRRGGNRAQYAISKFG